MYNVVPVRRIYILLQQWTAFKKRSRLWDATGEQPYNWIECSYYVSK